MLFQEVTTEKGHWTGIVTRGPLLNSTSRKTPGTGSSEKIPGGEKQVFLLEPGTGAQGRPLPTPCKAKCLGARGTAKAREAAAGEAREEREAPG